MKFWLLIRVVSAHNRSTFGNDRKILKGGFDVVKSIFAKTGKKYVLTVVKKVQRLQP